MKFIGHLLRHNQFVTNILKARNFTWEGQEDKRGPILRTSNILLNSSTWKEWLDLQDIVCKVLRNRRWMTLWIYFLITRPIHYEINQLEDPRCITPEGNISGLIRSEKWFCCLKYITAGSHWPSHSSTDTMLAQPLILARACLTEAIPNEFPLKQRPN